MVESWKVFEFLGEAIHEQFWATLIKSGADVNIADKASYDHESMEYWYT